ncbi:PH domain-containing protein [Pirellulaceae bacterium SH449]
MSHPENAPHGLHQLSLLFEVATRVRRNLVPAVFASFSVISGGVIGLYVGGSIFGIAILLAVIRYLTFRYQVVDNELHVEQGLIFRQKKAIPLERIQNIDSVQNLFHRMLKVAEVRIETASGSEAEATMRVLGLPQLEQLRNSLHLADEKSAKLAVTPQASADSDDPYGVAATPTESAAATNEFEILTISSKQLIQLGLLSNRGQIVAGIVLGYIIQGPYSDWIPAWLNPFRSLSTIDATDRDVVRNAMRGVSSDANGVAQTIGNFFNQLGTVGMVVVGVIAFVFFIALFRIFSAVWHVLRFHDYRLVLRGDSLHVQCGLLTKVSATVPRNRIQRIGVNQTWLMKKFGFVSVQLETSGGSEKESHDATKTVGRKWFIPIMQESEQARVLNALNPGLHWDPNSYQWQPLSKKAFRRTCRWPIALGVIVVAVGIFFSVFLPQTRFQLGSEQLGAFLMVLGAIGSAGLVAIEWKQSKSRKYTRNEQCLVYRSGVLKKTTSICFVDRVQSIQMSQSPFDRRWGMATLHFDTAGSGGLDHQLKVELLDASFAHREFQEWNALVID